MYHSRFSSTHYEAGYNWGRLVASHGKDITANLPFELTQERIAFAGECRSSYEKYFPEILEEIEGLAKGAGLSRNALEGILLPMYCEKMPNLCTCFALSDGENTVFGRNSDFLSSYERLTMNCLYKLKGSYAFTMNTTSYVEAEDGINEKGLCVGLTFVFPATKKPGLSAGLIVRYLLEKCANVDEALKALSELPVASTHTLTLADPSGNMAVVEANPQKSVTCPPALSGSSAICYVAAVNDFHADGMLSYKAPSFIDNWRSEERYQNVIKAAESAEAKACVDFAAEILSGKHGFMCDYVRNNKADTVWSCIYDLTGRAIYRCEGNPKRKKYVKDERFKF